MSLRDKLTADMKDAMKAGEKKKLNTIRLMTSAIKEKEINSRTEGHDSAAITDAGILDVLTKMVKQRQDSIAAFDQGGPAVIEDVDVARAYRDRVDPDQYLPPARHRNRLAGELQLARIAQHPRLHGVRDCKVCARRHAVRGIHAVSS